VYGDAAASVSSLHVFARAGRDPKAIQNDAINVVEIDAEERIVAAVTFDLEDFDAAIGGARCPIPRQRSGRPRADVVSDHGRARRDEPARATANDAGTS